MAVAGWARNSSTFAVHLKPVTVVGHAKVMETRFEVEEEYPHIGASMGETFFSGNLQGDEVERWEGEGGGSQRIRRRAEAGAGAEAEARGRKSSKWKSEL